MKTSEDVIEGMLSNKALKFDDVEILVSSKYKFKNEYTLSEVSEYIYGIGCRTNIDEDLLFNKLSIYRLEASELLSSHDIFTMDFWLTFMSDDVAIISRNLYMSKLIYVFSNKPSILVNVHKIIKRCQAATSKDDKEKLANSRLDYIKDHNFIIGSSVISISPAKWTGVVTKISKSGMITVQRTNDTKVVRPSAIKII